MKTIQPFIDLGFYTVPLKGKLERLDNGDKTTPRFEKGWKAKYQTEFNEQATEIGGTITGSLSGIIAIDCDDQETYDLFCGLDGENTFRFISKGKPKGGGTVIYKYPTDEDIPSFSIQSSILHLDFYSDNGFVYLPTRANKTKVAWDQQQFTDLPPLRELPATVFTLLRNLHAQYTLSKAPKEEKLKVVTTRANYLAPQLELLKEQKKFLPSLFRVITPKAFRDLPQYVKHGYLHPAEVPEGRGSEYISKVSAILGADPSVNSELYQHVIEVINNLWQYPIAKARLEQTITAPMLNGNSSINGEAIWTYDEHWKERGLSFTTKLGDAVEVFFDDIRASYYLINYTNDMIKIFYKDSDLFGYIEPLSVALPSRKDLKIMVPVVRTKIKPTLPFGFYSKDEYHREFNMFKQTPAMNILLNPKEYKDLYKRPQHILDYFDILIPDMYIRNYVLKFMKRKLTLLTYSPVILYFLGTHGSGKDTFVNLIAQIIGQNSIARPTTKEFLEMYNGWMVDKYFIQLDEYGNQLSKFSDKQEALGKIKAYTGKPEVQIRQMRTDGFQYFHSVTYIMTANTNPLMIEDEDRRVCLIPTPNVLKHAEQVAKAGGMSKFLAAMEKEINDFCYYLATEVDMMSADEYVSPPETDTKRVLIASTMPAAQRLGYYMKHSMFEQLEELVIEAELQQILNHSGEGRIYEDELFELYTYMTEGRGTKRGLTKVFREYDYEKIPTTKDGVKAYYYHVNTLRHYKPKHVFNDETEEQVTVRGVD